MSPQDERPALDLRKRRTPRPAADESVDPIDYRPQAAPAVAPTAGPRPDSVPAATSPAGQAGAVEAGSAAQSAVPAVPATTHRGRPRREVTVPFSTRLSVDVLELIDEATARGEGGGIIRNVVEEAIRSRWGKN